MKAIQLYDRFIYPLCLQVYTVRQMVAKECTNHPMMSSAVKEEPV